MGENTDNPTEMSKSNDSISLRGPSLPDVFAAIINVSKGGVYHEPSCLFCCSKHRDNAEKMYKQYDLAVKDKSDRLRSYFLTLGEDMSLDVIRNHTRGHMDKGELELRKVEYLSKISNLSMVSITTIGQVDAGLAVLWECIAASGTIASDGKSLSNSKAIEMRAGIISKLVRTWVDLLNLRSKILGEMKNSGEMMSIPVAAFSDFMSKLLMGAKNNEEKETIFKVMEGIKELQR